MRKKKETEIRGIIEVRMVMNIELGGDVCKFVMRKKQIIYYYWRLVMHQRRIHCRKINFEENSFMLKRKD